MKTPKKLKTPKLTKATSKGPSLIVGVFNDDFGSMMGGSGEEEFEEIRKTFPSHLEPFVPKWYRARYPGEVKPGTDVLLFDYGGMSIGNDLMGSNCRWIIQWCKDNPSSLVLVTSSFTYSNGMKWELEDQGLDCLPNLVNFYECILDKEINPIPEWFYSIHKVEPPATYEQARTATKAAGVSVIKEFPDPWKK